MSRRDALRSYRRAYRRGIHHWGNRTHPRAVELARRGDRLHVVFGGYDIHGDWPAEVVDALTTRDLTELKRMDREEADGVIF